jgi:hypothetical protein
MAPLPTAAARPALAHAPLRAAVSRGAGAGGAGVAPLAGCSARVSSLRPCRAAAPQRPPPPLAAAPAAAGGPAVRRHNHHRRAHTHTARPPPLRALPREASPLPPQRQRDFTTAAASTATAQPGSGGDPGSGGGGGDNGGADGEAPVDSALLMRLRAQSLLDAIDETGAWTVLSALLAFGTFLLETLNEARTHARAAARPCVRPLWALILAQTSPDWTFHPISLFAFLPLSGQLWRLGRAVPRRPAAVVRAKHEHHFVRGGRHQRHLCS